MSEVKQPSQQLLSIIPVVFAAVLGVLVGTQFSLIDKINRLEARAERMADIMTYERIGQQGGVAPVTCTIAPPKAM